MIMATKKLKWINSMIDAGRTVYITNALQSIVITAKNKAVLNIKGKSLYVNNKCVDYCKLSAR